MQEQDTIAQDQLTENITKADILVFKGDKQSPLVCIQYGRLSI